MNFNDFEYKRADVEAITKNSKEYIRRVKEAASFEEAHEAFKGMNDSIKNIFTNLTLCSIRHSIDTRDKFYEDEQAFWDESTPVLVQLATEFNNAVLDSPYLDELKAIYPKTYFLKAENARRVIDEKNIEDMQEENRLTTQYMKIIASAKLNFDGKELTLAQMGPYLQSVDRDVRKAAAETSWGFYKEHEKEFDEIYDKLVKLRDGMAKKLGFKNYTEMAYPMMNRFDYNEEMVANYRAQVLEEVVPVVSKLRKRQAKRIGLDSMKYYDTALNFLDGNATPIGDDKYILEKGREMYHELSPETSEFIDLMLDSNLMDVLAKPGKQSGGYMTFLSDYKVPFIFSNFNGTSGDVDVLTHEAGHAFQGYQARNIVLDDCIMPTMESCEIHSMSMEFLTWPYMDKFFGEKADKYRFTHLAEGLIFLPYGVMVDHFQHEVYNNPEMTPQEKKAVWKKLEGMYRPDMNFDGNEFLEEGGWWFRQNHIFNSPFYYIDYTLAQVCAFQFWKRKYVEKDQETWNDYLKICKVGGTKTFTEIVAEAGLISPFQDGCLKSIVKDIDTYLDAIDDSKL
ncbi:MAG: M3 family oligoendopeptidase [Clostridiaceae bacterium]